VRRTGSEKLKRLEDLQARIVRDLYLKEWREVWFFPSFGGVDGWCGTQRIMFVGRAPSTGHFPTEAERSSDPARRLYTLLNRQGLARAHLTDAIKERVLGLAVGDIEADKARMERYRRYLEMEIDIIRPRLIVAMGERTYRIMNDWLGSDPRLRRIPHYSPRKATEDTRRHFIAELRQISREYEHMCGRRKVPRTTGR